MFPRCDGRRQHGKRIVMVPMGNASTFNLQTTDVNDILRGAGLLKAK
jgi:hypothetical protein